MKTDGKFIVLDQHEMEDYLFSLEVKREIRLIQNHHTWQPDYTIFNRLPDHLYWMASMERFHKLNGFAEIAQQLTTFPDGRVAVGRSFEEIPAGIKGANQYGICIEHLGNFDTGGDVMTDEHCDAIIKLNAVLSRKFSLAIDSATIVYHHWWDIITGRRTNGSGTVKSCPGTNFFGGNSVQSCEKNFLPRIEQLAKTLKRQEHYITNNEQTR